MSKKREFDVIVWGATGFIGQLVAEYLLQRYGLSGELKWAVAGRSEQKLKELTAQLKAPDLPVVLADSKDMASLRELAAKTKVVCTTVGPYALYGTELVQACVEQGTDYCDLSGEPQWIRRMIDRFHEQAVQNNARIVHCCGFDSIPSEFAVYRLQQLAQENWGEYAKHIKFRLKAAKGTFSGGTIASMNRVLAEAEKDREVARVLRSPYTLNPDVKHRGKDRPDLVSVVWDADLKSWLMPFIMATINTRVVRRSHALLGFPYGQDFVYDEAMIAGSGLTGRAKAWMGLAGVAALSFGKEDSLYRKLLNKVLPKPGEGPSAQMREEGFFKFIALGKSRDGRVLKLKVNGKRDPGYGATSRMLGESAVCLALDPAREGFKGGMLTPSTAMGDHLLQRLQNNADLRFELMD